MRHARPPELVEKILTPTPTLRRFSLKVVGAGDGQEGLSVFVCDRLTGVYDKPRAIAIDHEVMRVMQQLGVAEAVARGHEVTSVSRSTPARSRSC